MASTPSMSDRARAIVAQHEEARRKLADAQRMADTAAALPVSKSAQQLRDGAWALVEEAKTISETSGRELQALQRELEEHTRDVLEALAVLKGEG